jgi:tRNA(fMet)-specific endonuclease VapC
VFLLDTNHSSKLLDGHPDLIRRLQFLKDAYVCTCVIVQGELRFMAERSEQREINIVRLRTFFRDIDVHPVSAEVADVYGEIKNALLTRFGPRNRNLRRGAKLEQLGFTDNDLWIAAIAVSNNLTVVSQDSDFARIAEANPALQWESWLGATQGAEPD